MSEHMDVIAEIRELQRQVRCLTQDVQMINGKANKCSADCDANYRELSDRLSKLEQASGEKWQEPVTAEYEDSEEAKARREVIRRSGWADPFSDGPRHLVFRSALDAYRDAVREGLIDDAIRIVESNLHLIADANPRDGLDSVAAYSNGTVRRIRDGLIALRTRGGR